MGRGANNVLLLHPHRRAILRYHSYVTLVWGGVGGLIMSFSCIRTDASSYAGATSARYRCYAGTTSAHCGCYTGTTSATSLMLLAAGSLYYIVFIPKYTVKLYNLVLFCNASSSACAKAGAILVQTCPNRKQGALAPANTLVDLHSIPQQWSGHGGRVLLHWTSALVSLLSCRKKKREDKHDKRT